MHGTIGKDHHAMLAEHRVGNQHNEGSRYNADARKRLHILECRAQYVARGVVRTGHLAVHIAVFDHQRSQVERIDDQFFSLFAGQSFAGTQLQHQFDVLLFFRIVLGIDDRSLTDLVEVIFRGQMVDLVRVADQYQLGEALFDDLVGRLDVPLFGSFGQDDGFDLFCGFRLDSFNKFHDSVLYSVVFRNQEKTAGHGQQ